MSYHAMCASRTVAASKSALTAWNPVSPGNAQNDCRIGRLVARCYWFFGLLVLNKFLFLLRLHHLPMFFRQHVAHMSKLACALELFTAVHHHLFSIHIA